ncbi:MAG: HEAT repeat domain-containing protein [Gemmatimonadetes bacterium]|nr:HEAT repeat domain-containing protein [Gemmatimonadota bacterium]MBT5059228.1 HEAT repeat domain-containing protein [Gemmatimonadota bacterium]MBT5145478.1 HEAT repeat domain-containing protein [Gemmatimonadota bacterium]MBT5591666.1 HEAT repeat domain-containing protein [Gemmatimonadota bacterium]MBT5961879.1 HEAT repeat domain-containing protein [Gemmatimonadota bacterium]
MSTSEVAYTQPDRLIQDFASRGLVVLAPEDLGIPLGIHEQVFIKEKAEVDAHRAVTPGGIPEVLQVLNSPGLVAACNQLIGENWAIVPFTHNASFVSGGRDQHWHKDDNGPYNGRKQRHHQAVQIEMLYYPQDVRPDMGPTATIPYSQYWTFNHEENHDNFAGADHLDFAYQISGMEGEPVSGPDSKYSVEEIVQQKTAHDIRMRDAVTDTGWPLVQQFEATPLRAGSIVLYSHNTFHRGNHRRDDWNKWQDNPRFMWRFWLYRTTDADRESPVPTITWNDPPVDPLTQIDLSQVGEDVTALWNYHDHWIRTGQPPPPQPHIAALAADERTQVAQRLAAQLHAKHEAAEPTRVGAAYRLAAIGDADLSCEHLGKALYTDRESVRRAATYGLIAVGSAATPTLLEAAESPIKWVRKAGVYGLGDASPLDDRVLDVVSTRLREDASVYVRAVAAGSLGCLGRRAVSSGVGVELIPACLEALVDCLGREENRPAMDRAQGRSIKFARPTDDSDVCEGGGIDFGIDRFQPVRSAVRENALWSVVMLCSHGAAVTGQALEVVIASLRQVVRSDENVFCVGLAMDALTRLAHLTDEEDRSTEAVVQLRENLLEILGESPVRGWEALIRGGLSTQTLAAFK